MSVRVCLQGQDFTRDQGLQCLQKRFGSLLKSPMNSNSHDISLQKLIEQFGSRRPGGWDILHGLAHQKQVYSAYLEGPK